MVKVIDNYKNGYADEIDEWQLTEGGMNKLSLQGEEWRKSVDTLAN